ncbi:MAG TPA: Crp/Fnr family transcriptional regulator [Lachnospiraceae bacterium]
MENYLSILKNSVLFRGISEAEILSMKSCLLATIKDYKKNDFVFRAGETTSSLGLVLSGSVTIIQEDFWGNRNIIAKIGAPNLFAETYALLPNIPLRVSVCSEETTQIMFFNIRHLTTSCEKNCNFHHQLIENLVTTMAQKNILMNEKLQHMSQRTTREKLLSYLSVRAQTEKSTAFTIPFNRQQLADYLSVDRSAMSNELSKLRDEGYLDFHKNKFTLHNLEDLG